MRPDFMILAIGVVWSLKFEVWSLEFGVWSLEFACPPKACRRREVWPTKVESDFMVRES
jgi:hypothetical protein